MKDKEEYFINYENKLIDSLKLNLTTLNKNINYIYVLCGVFTLYKFGVFKKISLIGNELIPNTVQFNLLITIILFGPYLIINNSLRNILFLIKTLKENAKKLSKENSNAIVFSIFDLKIYARGIIGVQFQFSNWVVANYIYGDNLRIKRNFNFGETTQTKISRILTIPIIIFGFSSNLLGVLLRFCTWILFLCLIYILPIFLLGFYTIEDKIITEKTSILIEMSVNTFPFIILSIVSIITLISNLKLLYFIYEKIQVLLSEILQKTPPKNED